MHGLSRHAPTHTHTPPVECIHSERRLRATSQRMGTQRGEGHARRCSSRAGVGGLQRRRRYCSAPRRHVRARRRLVLHTLAQDVVRQRRHRLREGTAPQVGQRWLRWSVCVKRPCTRYDTHLRRHIRQHKPLARALGLALRVGLACGRAGGCWFSLPTLQGLGLKRGAQAPTHRQPSWPPPSWRRSQRDASRSPPGSGSAARAPRARGCAS